MIKRMVGGGWRSIRGRLGILERWGLIQTGDKRSSGSVYLADVWRALWPDPSPDAECHLMPLGRSREGHDSLKETLVLVHGHYWVDNIVRDVPPMDRAFLFETFRADQRFAALHGRYNVYLYLYPTHLDYSLTSARLVRRLKTLLPDPHGERDVTMIAHSMGGLVARHALQIDQFGDRVKTLFTLATPHHGTLLASLILSFPSVWKKIGLLGYLVLRLARKLWRPTPGMSGMAADNLDARIPALDEVEFGIAVNYRLAQLNQSDPYTDRLVCLMGRIRDTWMPGRTIFDHIPRWYLGRRDPEMGMLDPLITPESGLASRLEVKGRRLLEGLDHESICTDSRSMDLLYRSLMGSAKNARRRMTSLRLSILKNLESLQDFQETV